jgi:hypothetical protein
VVESGSRGREMFAAGERAAAIGIVLCKPCMFIDITSAASGISWPMLSQKFPRVPCVPKSGGIESRANRFVNVQEADNNLSDCSHMGRGTFVSRHEALGHRDALGLGNHKEDHADNIVGVARVAWVELDP